MAQNNHKRIKTIIIQEESYYKKLNKKKMKSIIQ